MSGKKIDPKFLIGLLRERLDPFGDAEGSAEKAFDFFQGLGLLNEWKLDLSDYKPLPITQPLPEAQPVASAFFDLTGKAHPFGEPPPAPSIPRRDTTANAGRPAAFKTE